MGDLLIRAVVAVARKPRTARRGRRSGGLLNPTVLPCADLVDNPRRDIVSKEQFEALASKQKLLCFMNLWLAMVAAGLAITNWIGLANPYLILGTVFLLGIGFAFNAPAWTAIIPEVVTKEDLPSATTLGGLQLNISGIVGPAIGGLVLSWLDVNFVFAINSACFLLVILAVSRWKSHAEASRVPLEGFLVSLANAIRYIVGPEKLSGDSL